MGWSHAWGTRIGLPAPAPLLAIGAILSRTEIELILKSRKVVLARLSEAGFTFEFPLWSQGRSRTLRSRAQTLLR